MTVNNEGMKKNDPVPMRVNRLRTSSHLPFSKASCYVPPPFSKNPRKNPDRLKWKMGVHPFETTHSLPTSLYQKISLFLTDPDPTQSPLTFPSAHLRLSLATFPPPILHSPPTKSGDPSLPPSRKKRKFSTSHPKASSSTPYSPPQLQLLERDYQPQPDSRPPLAGL